MIPSFLPLLQLAGLVAQKHRAEKAKRDPHLRDLMQQQGAHPPNYTQIFGGTYNIDPLRDYVSGLQNSQPREFPHPPPTPYTKTVAIKCRLPECPEPKDSTSTDGYCSTHARWLAEWLQKP